MLSLCLLCASDKGLRFCTENRAASSLAKPALPAREQGRP
jgi:hypothetical protein